VANIASSKKDARRSAVRAARNRSLKSSVKTKVTRFRRGAAEEVENLDQLAVTAVAALDRAVSKGVLHANNAARKKSRLTKRLNATAQAPEPAPKPQRAAARGSTRKTEKAPTRRGRRQ
jgi:small subunit ribosomal protein S20